MRILVVTNLFPSEELPSQGIFVLQQVEEMREAGLDVRVLHVNRATAGRRSYFGAGRAIEAALARHNPDLVHVRYGGVLAAAATRACAGRPLVVTFCGNDLLGPGAVTSPLERLYGTLSIRASRFAARRASGVIAVSRQLAEHLPSGVDPSHVWVIPDGVDLERFSPADRGESRRKLGWSDHSRHILFPAARNRPEKRYGLAVAATDVLRARGIAVELHALEDVAFDEVPLWLNACDALVMVSLNEGSPNAVKEALACNVNVVGVDVGDVSQQLDGIAGCAVADAEPGSIADALELCFAYGRPSAARDRAAEVSLQRVGARVRAVYAAVSGR